MAREWLWWLGEFGLAATVAIVAGFVTKDVPISILYGLFVGTVFFVLRQLTRITSRFDRQVSEMEDKALNLPTTFSHLENADPYMRNIFESERKELLRIAKDVNDGEVVVRSRPTVQIMLDFHRMIKPGDRVIATNSGANLGTPQWEILRQLDYEMAENGADVTRIFIEPTDATPEDKKLIRQEMDEEKEHHKVRFIKESKLPPGIAKNGCLIGDRYYAYVSALKAPGSKLRQIIDEITVFTRRDELEKAKEITENLIRLSEEYK
jgi:hypothetical protein